MIISKSINKSLLHLNCASMVFFLWLYCLSLILVFNYYIEPSLTGEIPLRIAADSTTYMDFAERIKNKGGLFSNESIALISLSGNFLGPVLIASLLNNDTSLIASFNVILFILTYYIIIKNIPVNKTLLLYTLLLNPLMYLSLLCVNKEIIGFTVISLFACYLNNRKKILFMFTAILLSILVRWELTVVMIVFFLMNNEYLGFNRNRITAFVIMIIAITITYPSLAQFIDTTLSSDSMEGNTIVKLTDMQKNYQFFIVAIPKMIFNVFGTAINWFRTLYIENINIITNIIIGSEIFNILVITALLIKKRLTIYSNFIYFYVFLLLLFSLTPFVQSRYIFPCYVLLCLELCRKRRDPYTSGLSLTYVRTDK